MNEPEVTALLEDHAIKQDFKGHAHWLSCSCEQARGLRKSGQYGDPGLRWADGGWVTAPAEPLR